MKQLKRLDTTSRYRAIQDALRAYIMDNRLQPGDRLPSETELASSLGVSRNPVREAIKSLEALGLVEVRVGLGVFVKATTLDDILTNFAYSLLFDGSSVSELYEIRQRLELSYAREAVHQLTEESLQEMGQLLTEMEREFEAGKDFSMPDLALHRVLFHAVGNSTLIKLFDIFTAIYANSRHLFQAQPRDEMADDLQKHKLLLEALRHRDEDLVIERLKSTYTPLPALLIEPRKTNGA